MHLANLATAVEEAIVRLLAQGCRRHPEMQVSSPIDRRKLEGVQFFFLGGEIRLSLRGKVR